MELGREAISFLTLTDTRRQGLAASHDASARMKKRERSHGQFPRSW